VSPAVQALCFLYGQEVAGGLVPQLFGTVDRSVDLSQERFHSEYYDPLELRVHVATAMSALVLLPVYLCAAAAVNRHVAFGTLVKRAIISVCAGTLLVQTTFTLFGAPLMTAAWKTLALSLLLGVITALPLGCTLGGDVKGWRRVISHNDLREAAEIQFYIPAALAAVGAWLGAFPIPLDWDRPWQAWPITCSAGAGAGHTVGLLAVAVYFATQGKPEATAQGKEGQDGGRQPSSGKEKKKQ